MPERGTAEETIHEPIAIDYQANQSRQSGRPLKPGNDPTLCGLAIHIASCDNKARTQHDSIVVDKRRVCLYTDRSCIAGHTGTAAVWPAKEQTGSVYMGVETTSTVYAAEIQGVCLALDMVRKDIS